MTASTSVRGTMIPMLFILAVVAIAGMMILGPGISTGRKPIQLPVTPLSEAEEAELKKALEWANDTFKQPSAGTQSETTHEAVIVNWKLPFPDRIPIDFTLNNHCRKHIGEVGVVLTAYEIYNLYKYGQCVVEDKYCRTDVRDGPMVLYLCEDPVSGLIGGLFVILDTHEIITGYCYADDYCREGSNYQYWIDLIHDKKEPWGLCR